MGKFFKGVVKFSVAAAAVGGLCYAFKDKDDLFADDLDLEMEDANRDYVTINPDDSEKSEEAAAEEPVEEAKAEDADAE